ncbi:MAG: FMN-binding negative transcriptional regulator [Hyphomicrobiales bacterium]|nr:FMN-binding negative transcriptional regulator [Hyphomicrobiales bacterium]
MYLPPAFRLDTLADQHGVIQRHPFATLITRSGESIVANHLPFMIDTSRGDKGVLRAHVARANPLWRTHPRDTEALVIFAGVDHYITPSWYATKRESGKVVPTWNYVAVHAYGPLQVFEDAKWLREQVGALTALHEAKSIARNVEPWDVTDAPETFIAAQLKAIVGIEMPITRIEGKVKASQNRPEADREGVVDGLEAQGTDRARRMASLVACPQATSATIGSDGKDG